MSIPSFMNNKRVLVLSLTAALAGLPLAAHSEEREDLEKLRATVLSLIDTLIKTGVLPRDKADALMRDAQVRANAQLAQSPPAELGADGKKIVRVPYVPEAVRVQMRDEIKAEVLAETRGAAAATTAAGSRFQVEGDMRLRAETIRPSSDNSLAKDVSFGNPDATRAADIWANPNFNTSEVQNRSRVRARLGFNFAVTDTVSTGLFLSTGSVTGPTSTNQTMATGASQTPGFFNKYGVVIDRAFIKYQPLVGLNLSGGRVRNPFMGTDLLWADDLNFEGFVLDWRAPAGQLMDSFVTAGWFPLAFNVPAQSKSRDLLAVQGGMGWQFGVKENKLKVAAALYGYSGVEGIKETTSDKSTVPGYVVRSEYGSGYRQRGNTLFRINANPLVDSATNWGLASSFRELNLTGTVDIAQFDPMHIVLTADFVRNLAFKRGEMQTRTGLNVQDGSGTGFLLRAQLGAPVIKVANEWNVSMAYRRLGSDAVLDAFTNSDFGLGGTNNKGFILGGNYGLTKNTWLTARWMSSQLLDSLVPAVRANPTQTKLSVDTFQLDLNARF
ncbi:putative porin [Paucibacter sp. TC2R-5]|uniref:putative porin n=1 Tax=Paucibacter sp. TC2R-5 TaxID=2893555 RepID=UPI0021E3AF9A|nr:putative porin [Paucibacter sp. TC2R-5]MCV2359141.1 putative porin [Paucibacter sp. TC2R-5]